MVGCWCRKNFRMRFRFALGMHACMFGSSTTFFFFPSPSGRTQMVSRTELSVDDSLIGGNASAEGPEGEGTENTVISGVDIVMNHRLQETTFTKEAYKKYIKDYMKS